MIYLKKIIWLSILTILMMSFVFGCGPTRINFDELVVDGTEVRIYEVFGMDCPGCQGGLENLINDIPGVVASEANWEKQQLRVLISSKTEVSDEAINEAVKQANFTLGKRIK